MVLLAAMLSAGCSSGPRPAGTPFPTGMAQDRTLDIHVIRSVRKIAFTNTTLVTLPPGRIWVNRFYSRPSDEPIAPGQKVTLDLASFVDEFGEPFRAGGFWATQQPDDVVLVQYQTVEGEVPVLLGLVVVEGRGR